VFSKEIRITTKVETINILINSLLQFDLSIKKKYKTGNIIKIKFKIEFKLKKKLITKARNDKNIIPKISNSKKFFFDLLRIILLKKLPLDNNITQTNVETVKIIKYPI